MHTATHRPYFDRFNLNYKPALWTSVQNSKVRMLKTTYETSTISEWTQPHYFFCFSVSRYELFCYPKVTGESNPWVLGRVTEESHPEELIGIASSHLGESLGKVSKESHSGESPRWVTGQTQPTFIQESLESHSKVTRESHQIQTRATWKSSEKVT